MKTGSSLIVRLSTTQIHENEYIMGTRGLSKYIWKHASTVSTKIEQNLKTETKSKVTHC